MELGIGLTFGLRTGAGGVALWTPNNLASPPHISLDADRLDLVTKSGSNVTAVRTVHTNLAANTPNLITHTVNASAFNNHGSFNAPGTAAQALNFSTNAGSLLANKNGCTMVFFGRFSNPAPSAFNSAIVNATTTSASATRASIATSSNVANCLRYVLRRLDADTANGDDVGSTNRGTTPFICILRQDNTGAVIGGGTPTKELRIIQDGAALVTASEPTGLGSGPYSNTNSAYIGFFNSGTVAQSLTDMHYGAIDDVVYTTADVERLEGYLAWKIGTPSMLPSAHPYRNDPPLA